MSVWLGRLVGGSTVHLITGAKSACGHLKADRHAIEAALEDEPATCGRCRQIMGEDRPPPGVDCPICHASVQSLHDHLVSDHRWMPEGSVFGKDPMTAQSTPSDVVTGAG